MKTFCIILLSIAVGVGRFFVHGHDLSWAGTYEAMAHIWVGALLVWCFTDKSCPEDGHCSTERIAAIACLVLITAIETVKFLTR